MHFSLKNWLQSFNFHITFRILHIVQFCTNLMSKKLCQMAILYSCRHWEWRIIWTKRSMCWLGYDATLLNHERKTISNFKIKIQNMSFEWFWFDKFQAIFIFKSFRDKSNLHQDENHFLQVTSILHLVENHIIDPLKYKRLICYEIHNI